jgi:two-component system, response regulator, stage 0 sporulation protein F
MNILLVAEDASFRLLLRKYLSDEGYTVIMASDSRHAMQSVRKDNIDFIISDLAMKHLDGIEFCLRARKELEGKEIPFILVSIYDDEITKLKVESLKNCGFIKKGKPPSEIIKMIHHLTTSEAQGGGLSSDYIPPAPKVIPVKEVKVETNDHLKARLLIVDDDDNLRLLLGATLREEGYNDITEAIDGGEAIELLQKQDFHLVLLDIIMPNVSGFGVLKFIHEHKPSTQVIMITAYADMKLAVEAKQLGAADFVAKPFMRDDLMKTIKQVLTSAPAEQG